MAWHQHLAEEVYTVVANIVYKALCYIILSSNLVFFFLN